MILMIIVVKIVLLRILMRILIVILLVVLVLLRFTQAARKPGEMAIRYADPGLSAIAGLVSFAEGNYDTAFLNLAAARSAMQSIGGSHAQRDVFERMTIDAGLRAGFSAQTAEILAERTALRGGAQDRFARTRQAALNEARRIPAQ